jgi:hypothetical protein
VIKKGALTRNQKKFFDKVYTQGLGEFFFTNKIDPKGQVNFPLNSNVKNTPAGLKGNTGILLPIGGGKDSIVSAEILKEVKKDFEMYTVGDYPFFQPLYRKVGKKYFTIQRTISPELFKQNRAGALNGHVPISAILAFIGVCAAILKGKKDIVLSNEFSANEENVTFKGFKINHQYSKSLEFEREFQNYVREFITPSIRYFSLLRPLTELAIAELFADNYFDKYAPHFSSCNRNFSIGKKRNQFFWCGNCPKCAFAYLVFAPFVPRPKLQRLFGGQSLFSNKSLAGTFKELIGQTGHKPFECVGNEAECNLAMNMASRTYPELKKFRYRTRSFNYHKLEKHSMPFEFVAALKRYLHSHEF